MLHGHECPSRIPRVRVVSTSLSRQHTPDPGRAPQLDFDVPSFSVLDPYFNIDVLQLFEVIVGEHLLSDAHRAQHSALANELAARVLLKLWHDSALYLDGFGMKPGLRLYKLPVLRSFDVPVGIESTETVFIGIKAARKGRGLPVGIVLVNLSRGQDTEMLDIAPCQIRPVNFEF
jgi:hypothetical protein